MNQLLHKNQSIHFRGLDYYVGDCLGSGSQGEVYRILNRQNPIALKWYYKNMATDKQKKVIGQLVEMGPPDHKFLWPKGIVESPKIEGFGYVMPLRPSRYKNIVDIMKRRIEPTFSALIKSAIELCDSFLKLHKMGLCYKDISFGNIFFEPDTGDVLICDNDNVVKNGDSTGVLGTPKFMAPEIVTGASKPNVYSDLFSLSVLLFYMLMMHHPLEGLQETKIKCLDLPAMNKLYGSHATFIFDPINTSNRPSLMHHKNALIFWPLYTENIRSAFEQTFTRGIKNPSLRVGEERWRDIFIEAKNSILYCDCGAENFYDRHKIDADYELGTCWHCGNPIPMPARIKIGQEVIMLNNDTKLYAHHIISNEKYNFRKISARVEPHPFHQNTFGLKNLSAHPWQASLESGKSLTVLPNMHLTIQNGLKINFGDKFGEVRI